MLWHNIVQHSCMFNRRDMLKQMRAIFGHHCHYHVVQFWTFNFQNMYIYIYVYMCIYMNICIYILIYICVYIYVIYVYIYTYIHIIHDLCWLNSNSQGGSLTCAWFNGSMVHFATISQYMHISSSDQRLLLLEFQLWRYMHLTQLYHLILQYII